MVLDLIGESIKASGEGALLNYGGTGRLIRRAQCKIDKVERAFMGSTEVLYGGTRLPSGGSRYADTIEGFFFSYTNHPRGTYCAFRVFSYCLMSI